MTQHVLIRDVTFLEPVGGRQAMCDIALCGWGAGDDRVVTGVDLQLSCIGVLAVDKHLGFELPAPLQFALESDQSPLQLGFEVLPRFALELLVATYLWQFFLQARFVKRAERSDILIGGDTALYIGEQLWKKLPGDSNSLRTTGCDWLGTGTNGNR